MRNINAKQLLEEVQQLKKLASKDWLEDYVFEYEDEQDLRNQLEDWAAGHVSQHRIEDVTIQGDIAYVTYTRTQPIRIMKKLDWYSVDFREEYPSIYKGARDRAYREISDIMFGWARKSKDSWQESLNPIEGTYPSIYLDSENYFEFDINLHNDGYARAVFTDARGIEDFETLDLSSVSIETAMADAIAFFKKEFNKWTKQYK